MSDKVYQSDQYWDIPCISFDAVLVEFMYCTVAKGLMPLLQNGQKQKKLQAYLYEMILIKYVASEFQCCSYTVVYIQA